MTMSNTAARFFAIAAFSALSLTACGAPAPITYSPAPPPSYRVCLGPESPDDLEDLVDVDVVAHADDACLIPRPGFAFSVLPYPVALGDSPDAETVRAHRIRTSPSRAASTTAPQSPAAAPGRGTAPTVAPTPTRAPAAPTAASTPSSRANPAPAPRVQAPAPAPRPAPAPPRPAPSRPR